jgi:hypothetical protein
MYVAPLRMHVIATTSHRPKPPGAWRIMTREKHPKPRPVSEGGRRHKTIILLMYFVFSFLQGVACGTDVLRADIGEECTDYMMCGGIETRAACITEWSGGYCTELSCTLGSCPLGSVCVTGITFAHVNIDAFCLATCETNENCREAYMCTDVGQGKRTCTPR